MGGELLLHYDNEDLCDLGCTNSDDPNYDSNANTNDGSCASISGDIIGIGNEDEEVNGTITSGSSNLDSAPYSIKEQPSYGTATINSTTGYWSYNPNQNYHGQDSFTVSLTANDGSEIAEQIITITVYPIDDTVNVSGDITGNAFTNGTTTGQLTIVDDDALDSDSFSITTNPNYGTVSIQHQVANELDIIDWIYTPQQNYYGNDSFTLSITDLNGNTSTQTVTITVSAIEGCTDSASSNYDSSANLDNGSCTNGCTDSSAYNYNSSASVDNNTCEYSGCTDSSACNYNSTATIDDGNCQYIDDCGICGGGNSTCIDCAGIVNGTTVEDDCGVCGGDNSSCTDCSGILHGTTTLDICGTCGGTATTMEECTITSYTDLAPGTISYLEMHGFRSGCHIIP